MQTAQPSYLKRFLPYLLPYKRFAFLNILFNTLYALFSALSFVALIPMLEILFNEKQPPVSRPVFSGNLTDVASYLKEFANYKVAEFSHNDTFSTLSIVIFLVIVLFLLKNFFNYLAVIFISYLRNGMLRDLRNKLYQKTLELPVSYLTEKRKGDIMARLVGDVNEVQYSLLSILEVIVREPLTIIFTVIIMFSISLKLTLFVFLFIPISGYFISKIGKTLRKHSLRLQNEQGYFLSILEETIGGLKIVKAFNAEDLFLNRFENSTDRFYNLSNRLMRRQVLAAPVSEFLGILVIAILLWFGGAMVLSEHSLNGSEFIAFMGLAYNILTPAKNISKASYDFRRGNAAAARIIELLDFESPIKEKENAIVKSTFDQEISFNDISFAYDSKDVLSHFSLSIKKGQMVAIVGASGSGKSTLAQLLTRFYDVQQGSIQIDGKDLRDLSVCSLRNLIGVVSQDSVLFNDTVTNNLKVGKRDATDQEIITASQIANAYEFIEQMPEKFNTFIGDSGSKLSGGQKQRLSIARAVLKNPPIMILDEATSALDTESERLVQNALEKMMKNRTSIVIAHRLSTIQNADRIIVMHEGKIAEQGSHNELIARGGIYKKLIDMQSLQP